MWLYSCLVCAFVIVCVVATVVYVRMYVCILVVLVCGGVRAHLGPLHLHTMNTVSLCLCLWIGHLILPILTLRLSLSHLNLCMYVRTSCHLFVSTPTLTPPTSPPPLAPYLQAGPHRHCSGDCCRHPLLRVSDQSSHCRPQHKPQEVSKGFLHIYIGAYVCSLCVQLVKLARVLAAFTIACRAVVCIRHQR